MYNQSNDSNMNMSRKIREVARTYYKLYRTPESGVQDCNNKQAHMSNICFVKHVSLP